MLASVEDDDAGLVQTVLASADRACKCGGDDGALDDDDEYKPVWPSGLWASPTGM